MIKPKEYKANEVPDYVNQKIFSWKDRYYMSIGGLKFFVMDRKANEIEELEVVKIKQGSSTKESFIETNVNQLAKFSVEEAIKYKPFLSEPLLKEIGPLYGWRLRFNNGIKEITPKRNHEVLRELKNGLIAFNQPKRAHEIMCHLGNLLGSFDLLKFSNNPPYPGFFRGDGKVVSAADYKMPDQDELKEALIELHQLSEYYEEFKKQLNFTLHWNIMAPFSFYKKQRIKNRMGLLYLHGTLRAGKATMAVLSCHIWDQEFNKQFITPGLVYSESSLSELVSQSTFPLIFKDGNGLFRKKLLNIFENAVCSLTVRDKYNPVLARGIPVPALASMIITSNEKPPKNDYFGEDLHALEFKRNRLRTEKEMQLFNKRFNPENNEGPLRKLKAIGAFTANYLEANPEIIELPWKEAAEVVWRAIYEHAGIEMPGWMNGCAGDSL